MIGTNKDKTNKQNGSDSERICNWLYWTNREIYSMSMNL